MLGVDVHAMGLEVVEVGACRYAVNSGVPPVGLGGYVGLVVYATPCAVVDGEVAVFEAIIFQQSTDDKAVVGTVAIGCDEVGVGESGVTVVTIPIDVEVVVDGAVAARLVDGVVDIVCYGVVEEGVENKPGQQVVGDGVVDGRVATWDDMKDEGDDAVLAMAASEVEVSLTLMKEPCGVVLYG